MSGTIGVRQDDTGLTGRAVLKPILLQQRIQAHVNKGSGSAAKYLGAPFTQYRPTDPMNPLTTSLGSVLMQLDPDPKFSHRAPSKYNNPIVYGLFDATFAQQGDYFIGTFPTPSTVFLAGLEPNKPPMMVQCNTVVNFFRPNPNPAGPSYYSGDLRGAGETPLLAGWPASALQGTKGERGAANLPGDVRQPWVAVLLPSYPGVFIQTDDRMSDELGRFYTISSAELTDLGWRLTAMLSDT